MERLKLFYIIILLLLVSPVLNAKNRTKNAISDSTQVIINDIIVSGNKKTKEKIILQELLFEKGDTVYAELLDELIVKSKESLFNTSLFNFITINTLMDSTKRVDVVILLEERWYLWPQIIFEHADRNLSSFLRNGEWSRLNYGLVITKSNFRGRRETLRVKLRFGFKEQFQISYKNPYLAKSKKHGISTEFEWFRQNELPYITLNDQLVYYKDPDNYVQKYQNAFLTYHFRPKHYSSHNFSFRYTNATVSDTIIDMNPNYFEYNENQSQFFTIYYEYKLDRRNYKHYPLNGFNIAYILNVSGLGLLKDEMPTVISFTGEAYKYFNITKRWYSGIGGKFKSSSNRLQPFFVQKGLGYKDYLRSFEYNVIDGQHFFTSRSFIKYAILPERITEFKIIGLKKFTKIHYSLYSNIFFDTGYVINVDSDPSNELPNRWLLSTGFGIDLVAYYDQIIRFEYSINQLGGQGFFLNISKAF